MKRKPYATRTLYNQQQYNLNSKGCSLQSNSHMSTHSSLRQHQCQQQFDPTNTYLYNDYPTRFKTFSFNINRVYRPFCSTFTLLTYQKFLCLYLHRKEGREYVLIKKKFESEHGAPGTQLPYYTQGASYLKRLRGRLL